MNINKIIKEFNSIQFLLLLFVIFPVLTYAVDSPTNVKGFIMIIVNLITAILPIIILLALIYFLWGLSLYLRDTGENKDDSKEIMLAGMIGFFIMTSVWGLIGLLSNTLGTDTNLPSDLGEVNEYLTGDGVENVLME